MREILFRGKSVKPGSVGKWVGGSYLDELEPDSEGNQHFILDPRRGTKRKYPIDPETLRQFTGLYDCTKWEELTEAEQKAFLSEKRPDGKFKTKDDWKGRMIFEGDIVENTLIHDMGFVIEHRIDFEFVGYVPVEIGRTGLSRFTDWRTFKIIGNIFDNPELIKKAT